jgi:DNA-binding beta-propeller fold protein YncE
MLYHNTIMTHPKTESRFNHWLNKKSFTAVLLCLFAVCCLAFSATNANCQSIAYRATSQMLTKGQAVNITPTSSGINPYGYDAVNYPNSTNYKTGFDYPNDIAIDKDGLNLYVADRYGKRIVVVPAAYSGNIEGHITKVYNTDANPFAIAVDQQNNIYYSDSSGTDIKKCLPSGGCSVYAPGAVTFAFSIAVDKAGNLYVVDSQEHKVKKIPAGAVHRLISVVPGALPIA